MFIGLTDEQILLRDSVRGVLMQISPEHRVRQAMASPALDQEAWSRLGEMGLHGLVVPESLGGSGGSFVDQGVVLEELGRVLYCGPYFAASVLAVQVLLALHEDLGQGPAPEAAAILSDIARSGRVATLALTEASGRWDAGGIALGARFTQDGWRLDGSKHFVPEGTQAEVILVVARSPGGISVFAVSTDAPGLGKTLLPTLDQTRKQARLDFADTPATLLGRAGEAWPAVERALRVAAIGLAAEQVGAAQHVLEMVTEYARIRRQFGRPIGSFQAVQHVLANLVVEVEAARSAAYYGLRAAAERSPELATVASIAKAVCSETLRRVTNDAIQVLGGIGLTWAHPVHLYFKRARSSEVLLGTPAYHRELVARELAL